MTLSEFNSCVDLYADNLYRFVLKNIRDKEKAKDIVQDTFEKLWKKVSDVELSSAKSYMFTTGYRTMVDLIRKDRKFSDVVVPETPYYPDSNRKEIKQVIDASLSLLPEIQRSVILLRDYEGYSYEEIGEITGLSPSQVKVYIYRARIFLKEKLVSIENVLD